MCSIDAHDKQQPSSVDDGLNSGDNALPSNLTTEALYSLGATIYFIDCCLKDFDQNDLARSNIYIKTMQYFFKKIPVQLHTHFYTVSC